MSWVWITEKDRREMERGERMAARAIAEFIRDKVKQESVNE